MTELPVLNFKDVIKALEKDGFRFISQKGSHIKFKKKINSRELIVIVPRHNEIKRGTLKAILRQAEMTTDYFVSLL